MIKALAAQMKATLSAIREFDQEIAEICSVHQDYELFQSLPGAGHVYASRLTAAMGSERDRWQSADELACLVGVAPVMERSGKSCWVRWRYLRPEVPAPDLPRVRWRKYQALVLGASLLRAAAGAWQEPSRGGALARLQVGENHLQMLADTDCLRRGEVSGELAPEGGRCQTDCVNEFASSVGMRPSKMIEKACIA